MIKKYWKSIVIVLIILVVVGGAYYRFYYQNKTTDQKEVKSGMVIDVQTGNLEKTIAAEGYVEAVEKEDLSFPVKSSGSTKIEKIYIEEGDRVKKDKLLMELDKTEARLKYLQKNNAYNRAKINGSKS